MPTSPWPHWAAPADIGDTLPEPFAAERLAA
jgi:hypothetical protein